MTFYALFKIIIGAAVGWVIGSLMGRLYRKKRNPWIGFKNYDPTGKRSFKVDQEVSMPLGKHLIYLIDDVVTGTGDLTKDRKKAAVARALGKSVYVLNFDRYHNFVQLKSCSTSVPGRSYNFLTDKFEGQVDPNKDSHVQYIQT